MKKHVQFCTKILAGIIICLGIFSAISLPWEKQYAKQSSSMQITAICPNKIAVIMQDAVTIPIEQSIQKLPFITAISSTTTDSASTITVELDNLSPEITTAKLQLISAVQTIPFATEEKVNLQFEDSTHESEVIFQFFLTSTSPNISFGELSTLAKSLFEKIMQIQNVQNVVMQGIGSTHNQLKVDLKKLQRQGISISSFWNQLEQYQQQNNVGTTQTKQISLGIYPLSTEELATAFLYGSLGRISLEALLLEPPKVVTTRESSQIRINGQDGIQFAIYKKKSASTIPTANLIQTACKEFSKEIPAANSLITIWNNSATEIKKTFTSSCKIFFSGLGIASVLLVIFFGKQVAIWSIGGTLFSLCGMLCAIKLGGGILYFPTLYGMLFFSGLSLCTCIFTTRKYQLQQQNFSATNNVFCNLRTVGMLTIAVIPVQYFPDITTHWIKEISLYFCIFSGVNFFTCGFFLPVLLGSKTNFPTNKESKHFQQIAFLYEKIYRKYFSNKRLCVVLWVGLLLSIFLLTHFPLFSWEEKSISSVKVTGDFYEISSLQETQNQLIPLENFLKEFIKPSTGDFYTTVGARGKKSTFEMVCKFSNTFPSEQFVKDLQKECTFLSKLQRSSLFTQGDFTQKEKTTFLEITGSNDALRSRATWDTAQYLRDSPEIEQIIRSDEFISESIFIEPSAEKIFSAGISLQHLQENLRMYFKSLLITPDILTHPQALPIRIEVLLKDFEEDLAIPILEKIEISTKQGKIPLQHLAKIYKKKHPNILLRKNGQATTSLQIVLHEDVMNPPKFFKNLLKNFKEFPNQYKGLSVFLKRSNKAFPGEFLTILGASIVGMWMFFLVSYTRSLLLIFVICGLWCPSFIQMSSNIFFAKQMDNMLSIFYFWVTFSGFLITFTSFVDPKLISRTGPTKSFQNFVEPPDIFITTLIIIGFFLPGILPIEKDVNLILFQNHLLFLVGNLLISSILMLYFLNIFTSHKIAVND